MEDSEITCDKIIESYDKETITVPTNFIENKVACKTQNFHILVAFLSITITLLVAVTIYCCLIKYRAKQKNVFTI